MSDLKALEKREGLGFQAALRSGRTYFLPLAFLIVPAAGMTLFSRYGSTLQPVFNVLFLLAVAAAAWWGGIVAGTLASVIAVLLFSAIAGRTTAVLPEHFRVTAVLILLAAAILVSQVASARRRAEEILAASNALLEQRVKERTEDLNRALRRLQQNNEELQHFAYAVSHDLQEPLRGLTISTQLLQRRLGTELNREAERLVQDILLGASRLNQLVRDLLTYTRVLGEAPEPTASANIRDTVSAVTFNLREQIQATNARIKCATASVLAVDAVHLEQVLQNLVSNALKYRSDRQPIIDVECSRRGDYCQVRVSDNGIGIHSDHHDLIFQPFSRLGTCSEAAGTGLGLALCRRIVERSGGQIWVESELGKGSSFYFTLPAFNREP